VVFVVDPDQDRTDVVRQARNVGYEELLGELDGGLRAWREAGHRVASFPLVSVEGAADPIVDVRQRSEYVAGHIPGSRNVELGAVTEADLPAGRLAVMCGHGERAMTAASLLARSGRTDVTVLTGGPADWARDHGPLDTGP
jgi:rhodanese-related sulfurtransferase